MGRAQVMQAEAAGIEAPVVCMNPDLIETDQRCGLSGDRQTAKSWET